MSDGIVRHVTCRGCGCTCDDLEVGVRDGRIESLAPPCPLARSWFADGVVPERVLIGTRAVSADEAVAAGADLLAAHAGRLLVFVGPDLTTQAQRSVVALADVLRATVETATSAPAAAGLLAAQRRGRAGATLGEIRNRADAVLYWAVDPSPRYPRYIERYAPGRSGRVVLSVSVGDDRGPRGGELEIAIPPDQEIAALSVLRAIAMGNTLPHLGDPLQAFAALGARLLSCRYVAIVHDGEPPLESGRDGHRVEGLIALTQALNGPTRAALSSLRSGGNRSGIEAVLTWQTGYPMAVDFSDGVPRYLPGRGANGGFGAALVAGSAGAPALAAMLNGVPTVVIGPRASDTGLAPAVAIDTGVAGIHEAGTAYRMDEVPLPLTPPLSRHRGSRETLDALLAAVRRRMGAVA